jgi:SAM-dependent methyltransferase
VRNRLEAAGRRFARLATRAVVARPALWRLFRRPVRRQFASLAPTWDTRLGPEGLLPLERGLDELPSPPRCVLDLGTGTGKAARVVATRFPDAEVTGVDLAPEMVREAQALLPESLAGRVSFQVGDGSALPFADGDFDLVVLQNMIPFVSELGRVTAPGGHVLLAFSRGSDTPIWSPPETLRPLLAKAGFEEVRELHAGSGSALLAAKGHPG